MKAYQIKCPACGAAISFENERKNGFCSYCGQQIHLDDEVERTENTTNINYHYTYTNEAKVKEIEAKERIEDKKHAFIEKMENKKQRKALVTAVGVIAVVIAYMLLFGGFFNSGKKASDKQEAELQLIVEEVLQDIEEGNYSEAYIKAESIYYTENWSSDIEEKWDSTRKELIKQIKEAEKENAKEEKKGKWWNPFD